MKINRPSLPWRALNAKDKDKTHAMNDFCLKFAYDRRLETLS
jgi:hypothetical protein